MRRILLSLVAAVVLMPLSGVFAFSEKGQDCSKCHTLTKEEATALLNKMDPSLTVLEVRTIPVKGLWEVDVEARGKKGLIYVDFTKNYLFSGSIIDLKQGKNITKDRYDELNKIDVSKIPLDDALVMGDRNAKHKVVVFDDPD